MSARFAVMYVATVVVGLVFASGPAIAGPLEDIDRELLHASWENHETITLLVQACSQATTVAQLDAALDAANRQLDQIFATRSGNILAIDDGFPEYEDDVQLAIGELTSTHNAAHADASYTYQLFLEALPTTTTTTLPPTTTTTTVPPTTTTTVAATTTTTVPDTTTTTTPDGVTTTTVPATTTTTTVEQTTTTTSPAAIAPIGPGPPPGDAATITDDATAVMTAPSIWAMATAETDAGSSPQTDESDQSTSMMSTTVMKSVSQVLPPALAQFTVAPFIVFEILVATLYDSARQMALPVFLIIVVMTAFVWLENRRSADSLPS